MQRFTAAAALALVSLIALPGMASAPQVDVTPAVAARLDAVLQGYTVTFAGGQAVALALSLDKDGKIAGLTFD